MLFGNMSALRRSLVIINIVTTETKHKELTCKLFTTDMDSKLIMGINAACETMGFNAAPMTLATHE